MTRFGFLSTYPPTRCGLATFTESLAGSVSGAGRPSARIVRVLDTVAPPRMPIVFGVEPLVVEDLVGGDHASIARSVAALNAGDVAVIQHEYGIYGGKDGDDVLAVLAGLTVPCIVVLHTVLPEPTVHQREVLESVCRLASAVVVMTEAARSILAAGYSADMSHVSVIPHGVAHLAAAPAHSRGPRTEILTWGLIGPGKGIEWAIRAMAELDDLPTAAHYTVVGQTHPKVLAHAGESYRQSLLTLIDELGLTDRVTLDGEYYDDERLAATVARADAVLLPYDSRVQVTSGVLVEAIAAGVPVVATAFPHAIELLADGAGIVVPHQSPTAIAAALRAVLAETEADESRRAAAAAALLARSLPWSSVGDHYRQLAGRLLTARAA